MTSRSFGTLTSFASSVRTASRVGVAAVAWSARKVYSVRSSSGFGRSLTILRSKLEPPKLHLRDERLHVFLRGGVDRHEGDPRTRDTVYNGRSGGKRFHEGERAEILLAVDL